MSLRERLLALAMAADRYAPDDSERIVLAAAAIALAEAREQCQSELRRLNDVQEHGGLTAHGEASLGMALRLDTAIRALAEGLE